MGQQSRTVLKTYFETGDKPTEAEFIDLIDSLLSLVDDNSDDITEGTVQLFLTELAQTINGLKSFVNGVRVDPNQTFLPANGVSFGDGDSGFYEAIDDQISVSLGGTRYFRFIPFSFDFGSNSRAKMSGLTPTATLPVFIPRGENNADTGYGSAAVNQLSLITAGVESARIEVGVQKFNGQAIGGDEIKTFASTPEFDFNDGNTQEITLTANITSWTIANELPAGQYTIYFIQSTGHTISDPTGIDKELNESLAAFDLTAGAINIVNVFVTPGGVSMWSIVGTA